MMTTSKDQNKIQRTVTERILQVGIRDQISTALQNGESCFKTFEAAGTLSLNQVLPGVSYGDGSSLYRPDQIVDAQTKIKEFRLTKFTPSAGVKYQEAEMLVVVTAQVKAGEVDRSFGAKDKGYRVPFFIITNDNKVEFCASNDSGAILKALQDSCTSFGGSFNLQTATCENIHSKDGIVLKRIRDKFCSTGNPACPHPYAGETCSRPGNTDLRGKVWSPSNWVVKGFDGSGNIQCECLPVQCAAASLYCLGTDLGTDKCQKDCGTGTRDVWKIEGPNPDSICAGVSFPQNKRCTDPIGDLVVPGPDGVGTMTDGPGSCSYDQVTTNPDGTTSTSSHSFDVSNSGECSCNGTTRINCDYTSNCASVVDCIDTSWSPSPASKCNGKPFTQISNCNRFQPAMGTKTKDECDTSCKSWGEWLPKTGDFCPTVSQKQTRKCNDPGSVEIQETPTVVKGTKVCGGACWVSEMGPGAECLRGGACNLGETTPHTKCVDGSGQVRNAFPMNCIIPNDPSECAKYIEKKPQGACWIHNLPGKTCLVNGPCDPVGAKLQTKCATSFDQYNWEPGQMIYCQIPEDPSECAVSGTEPKNDGSCVCQTTALFAELNCFAGTSSARVPEGAVVCNVKADSKAQCEATSGCSPNICNSTISNASGFEIKSSTVDCNWVEN